MARGDGNLILQNMRGSIGKELVVKQYADKIVLAKYPRNSRRKGKRKIKPTPLKKIYEGRFAEALKYSRAIRCNIQLSKKYRARLKPGQRLYNYLISEYMKLAKAGKAPSIP